MANERYTTANCWLGSKFGFGGGEIPKFRTTKPPIVSKTPLLSYFL